jgi:cell division protein FtsB
MARPPHRFPSLTPIVLGGAALLAAFLAISTLQYIYRNYEARREEAQLKRDILQLDRDHGELVAVRDYLESDEYVEDVARRVVGLVRPGETLVIVSSDVTPEATATPQSETTPGEPWWKELFGASLDVPTATGPAPVP